ncbi:maltase-glucoamylase-like [Diadema antillarum]|uniref:maltase-glucoamylase-like n=1 Tax=Diadema antillarum TaxID=105358 RepID=UPI003A8681D1
MKESMTMDSDVHSVKGGWSTKHVAIIALAITIIVTTLCTTLTYFLHPGYDAGGDAGPGVVTFGPEPESRVDCYPDRDASANEEECTKRGCVWRQAYRDGEPWCYFPPEYGAYRVQTMESQPWGTRLRLERNPDLPTLFGGDIPVLMLDVEYQTDHRIHFKIYDSLSPRFEVPVDMPSRPLNAAEEPMYDFRFTNNPFTMKIIRRSTGQVLFDTSIGALIFEDQFITISTRLPSTNVYGLGESEHRSFRHNLDWQTWSAFSRDQPPGRDNLYGVHPFYMCVENDAHAHGVLLLNSNAQDYTLQPTPALTYHTIGGVLDFYMFLGPTPESVIQQYTDAIGRPMMPPYWSLGYQLCRYGYGNLSNVQAVVESMRQYQIPHDVQYGDIDYMLRQLDFTVHPDNYDGLGEWVNSLKPEGTRYIIILDPAISANETNYPPYDRGVEEDVFIHDENGNIRYGKVWPDYPNVTVNASWPWDDQTRTFRAYAAFPDFRRLSTKNWWLEQIQKFHDEEIQFDGIWIDMNEPASFAHGSVTGCTDNTLDNPPFLPRIAGGPIYEKTICMNSLSNLDENNMETQYNMHSLYGWSQTEPTFDAARNVTGQRSLVISRSTFPSSGKYTGHWLGDNTSIWSHLFRSVIGMLEFNLFGIPYIGADVCGFFGDTSEELCRRWHQVGAFYPYLRNHNGLGYMPQDPGHFGEKFAIEVREVLHIRYRLLPYLYTLFYHAHTTGSTVVRSLMHEFTSDSYTWDIDRQFMWGGALLISPVLDPYTYEVNAYFPVARWYDYYNGKEASPDMLAVGGGVTLAAPSDHINLHWRGGYIIPTQQPDNSTMFSRRNPFGLIVALDDEMMATGNLFWDDGESIDSIANGEYFMFEYTFVNNILSASVTHSYENLMDNLEMDDVIIYGLHERPEEVFLSDFGDVTSVPFNFDNDTMETVFTMAQMEMDMGYSKNESKAMMSADSKTWRWTTQKVVVICIVLTACVTTLCTTLTYFLHPGYGISDDQPVVEPHPTAPPDRINCIPDRNRDSESLDLCEARGCVYGPQNLLGPRCYFPAGYGAYQVTSEREFSWGKRLTLERIANIPSFFNNDIRFIALDIEFQTNNRLHFKFYDPANDRFEVPLTVPERPTQGADTPTYDVTYTTHPFTLTITRIATGEVLWDTSIGAFIFEDQFLTISTRLPSSNIYGFGEHEHHSFKHDLNWQTWGMFSRDQPVSYKGNLYGVHPFYLNTEYDGNAHGVLLLNSNAQDFTVQPTPALTYRTIGGVLDFYMFLGPSPEEVVQQYTEVIGRPMMPPYWSLGYQLSRYGYNNLTNLQNVVQSMRTYDIPHDVQYSDIDYMERQMDFTIDPVNYVGLGDFVESVKEDGTRYIIMLDPAISANETAGTYEPFDLGVKMDVFIKDENGNLMYGKVWPDYPNITVNDSVDWDTGVRLFRAYAVFPDFQKNSTVQWWADQVTKFKEEINFDGLWIDMNEPASFVHGSVDGCPDNAYDYPPYHPNIWGNEIFDKTVCLNAVQQYDGSKLERHYNMHSLYGWSQSKPTQELMRNLTLERSLVVTRSTFPGSGKYAGHWLGDNTSAWPHIHYSIIGTIEFNLFGIPYVGVDICGFFNDSPEELCRRWHQVGAFQPYARNHNAIGNQPQHPAFYGKDFAEDIGSVLRIRYRLLPYLYTLFYHAHTSGSTVIRSLMHEFSSDSVAWGIDRQFMWGSALLISPVLEQDALSVRAYFPRARWFDYYTGTEVPETSVELGSGVDLDAPLDHINLHVRGGNIIPTQEPANCTMNSRKNLFGLIISLDEFMEASGELFWDDGVSIGSIENGDYFMFSYTFSEVCVT